MAETAAPTVRPDERLVRVGPFSRLLTRPDIGSLLGAVAVFFAFAYFARAVNWLGDPGIAAGWSDQAAQYGIVAVPVALLMIGGEFDLSAGVMIGSSGLLLGYLATHAHMNIWPAMAVVLLFGLAIGFINGVTVVRTKITLFMMTSSVASLMGIIEALELRSMQANEGIGLEFIFIICAVVGGCLLTGGYGSVIGAFFGAAMLGMVQLGIIDARWDSNWTFTFQGGILFAAVLLNAWVRTRPGKTR